MTGGSWIGVFPDELEDGDVWGEAGELVLKQRNPTELTWWLAWWLGDGHETYVEPRWPDRAPLRVFRPNP